MQSGVQFINIKCSLYRSSGEIPNGELSKKSPKSQLSGLHRELGAILKEIKVITDKIRESEETGSIEVTHTITSYSNFILMLINCAG